MIPDDSVIDPGSIKQMSNNVHKFVRSLDENNFSLTPELLQVAPEPRTDKQKILKQVKQVKLVTPSLHEQIEKLSKWFSQLPTAAFPPPPPTSDLIFLEIGRPRNRQIMKTKKTRAEK